MYSRVRLIAVFALLVAGCGPETPIDPPHTDPTPSLPQIKSLRYQSPSRLTICEADDPYHAYCNAIYNLALMTAEMDSQQVTSTTIVESITYLEVVTTNADGTTATVHWAEGELVAFESAQGNFLMAFTYGDYVDPYGISFTFSAQDASSPPLPNAYGMAVTNDGSINWLYGGDTTGADPLGKVRYLPEADKLAIDVNGHTYTFFRNDDLPPFDDTEVRCSVTDKKCEIRRNCPTQFSSRHTGYSASTSGPRIDEKCSRFP